MSDILDLLRDVPPQLAAAWGGWLAVGLTLMLWHMRARVWERQYARLRADARQPRSKSLACGHRPACGAQPRRRRWMPLASWKQCWNRRQPRATSAAGPATKATSILAEVRRYELGDRVRQPFVAALVEVSTAVGIQGAAVLRAQPGRQHPTRVEYRQTSIHE